MRNLTYGLLSLLVVALLAQPAAADEIRIERPNAVSFNLMFFPNLFLSTLTDGSAGSLSVEYQRNLSAPLSLIVTPGVVYLNFSDLAYDRYNREAYEGYGGELLVGLRYHPLLGIFDGMYLAAQLGGGWTDGGAGNDGLEAKGGFFSCTAELGYAYVWSNGFTIRGGIGVMARWVNWEQDSLGVSQFIDPQARLDLGYAW